MTRSPAERLASINGGGPTTEDLVAMVRDGTTIIGEATYNGTHRFDLEASNLRNTPSGLHAHVVIRAGGAVLAYSTMNVGRDEDRTRLANSAAKRLGDPKAYAAPIKLRFDQFCHKLWDVWTQADEASWTKGDEQGQPAWMLEPYIVGQGGTILYGPPGSTKSWTALLWAAALCCPQAGPWKAQDAKVMFVNLERSARSVEWRIARVAKTLGAPFELLTLTARGRSFTDIWDAARRSVEREKVDVVIVDSLSRAGAGDLTNNEPANRAMDALNALAATWVVIAHTPRSDGSHVFGSVMLEAAADICVKLQSVAGTSPDVMGMRLDVTKSNDMRKARPATWALEFDEGGLAGFRAANPGEFPDLAVAGGVAEQVADYLRVALKASGSEIAGELGLERGSVAMALSRDARFIRLGREGRAVLYGLRTLQEEPK